MHSFVGLVMVAHGFIVLVYHITNNLFVICLSFGFVYVYSIFVVCVIEFITICVPNFKNLS